MSGSSPKKIIREIVDRIKPIYGEGESMAIGRMLLEALFGLNRVDLAIDREIKLKSAGKRDLKKALERLSAHEPVQHILGYAWFMGKKYKVSPEVLIPRQETEELIGMVLNENDDRRGLKILDIGTGSGCIAVSLAYLLPHAEVHAADVSAAALEIANENAGNNDVRITFHQVDILETFPSLEDLDIIVSNPPYVIESEKKKIDRNVLDYEPGEALFVPDEDPLVFYQRILEQAAEKLIKGGRIYFEINEGMGEQIDQLMVSHGFKEVKIVKDLNGKDRIARGVK